MTFRCETRVTHSNETALQSNKTQNIKSWKEITHLLFWSRTGHSLGIIWDVIPGLCCMIPEHHQVLDHLFAQVVVYAVDLVLVEQRGQVGRQLLGALEVAAERLLNYHPVPASVAQAGSEGWISIMRPGAARIKGNMSDRDWLAAHAAALDVGTDAVVDGGRQSQVEEPVSVSSSRQSWQVSVQLSEAALLIVPASDVRVPTEEGWETLSLLRSDLREDGEQWFPKSHPEILINLVSKHHRTRIFIFRNNQ